MLNMEIATLLLADRWMKYSPIGLKIGILFDYSAAHRKRCGAGAFVNMGAWWNVNTL